MIDEDDSEEERLRKYKYCISKWEDLCTKQFQLIYYGKFDYSSIEDMSVVEIDFFYNMLVKELKEEKEAREKAETERINHEKAIASRRSRRR